MTYFEDLTEYTYYTTIRQTPAERANQPKMVNIGWLSDEHLFPTGPVPEETLARLHEACQSPVAITRGHHVCELCLPGASPMHVLSSGDNDLLGNGEIHIVSANGTIYAAPALVYHYVCVHEYLPPQEFLDALMQSPDNGPR
jgi:hypothetical protein